MQNVGRFQNMRAPRRRRTGCRMPCGRTGGLTMRNGRNRQAARLFRSAQGSVMALALLALSAPAISLATAPPARAQAQDNGPVGRTSGLPVPRFVSLKADKVNVRSGPSKD